MAKHLKRIEKSKQNNSILYSLDTIYNAGVPYAVMKKVHNESATYSDYDVYSLNGKLLIDINVEWRNVYGNGSVNKHVYYVYSFIDSKQEAEMAPTLTMKAYEKIVGANLVKDNTIDPAAEAKFVTEHPITSLKPGVVVLNNKKDKGELLSTANIPPVIARNKNAPLTISGKEIQQDNKTIGTFASSGNASRKVITIYHPDGTMIAEATCDGATLHDWRLFTMKDLRQYTVSSALGNDVKDIANFLVSTFYL